MGLWDWRARRVVCWGFGGSGRRRRRCVETWSWVCSSGLGRRAGGRIWLDLANRACFLSTSKPLSSHLRFHIYDRVQVYASFPSLPPDVNLVQNDSNLEPIALHEQHIHFVLQAPTTNAYLHPKMRSSIMLVAHQRLNIEAVRNSWYICR